jgi:hypothetical protein
MKSIYKFFGMMVIAAFFSACEDAIDVQQPGRLTPERTFETVNDLQNGLLGAYNELDITQQIQFNATFTDEISIGFDNGGQGIATEYAHLLNAQSAMPQAMWVNFYDAINASTRVIEAGALVEPGDEQADYNNVLGQAYAIRAYSHFSLLSYFSPDLTDDNAPGVIAVDFVPTIDQTLGRNTTGEVFAAINADLDQAANLISPDFADPTYMTRDFVTALRARIALYRKDYNQADQFAAQLIDSYELATPEEYRSIFWEDVNIANTEVIFKLARTLNDSYDGQGATGSPFAGGWAGANFAFVDATIDGSPYFEMGRTLFNLLADDTTDIRYDVNVGDDAIINEAYPDVTQDDWYETDIIPITKYPGVEGVQPLMNDLKVFRVSEMYLIRAEAAAANGDLAGAANFIKQVRDARFGAEQPAPVFTSQQEAFAGVLEERRVELAFEGHRWLDLKRLGAEANAQIDRDPLDCEITGACTLPVDDYRFTLPIPLVEINANPVIAEQQNPGYGGEE